MKAFAPALIMLAGYGLVLHTRAQEALPLARPLTTVMQGVADYDVRTLSVSPEEQRIAGMTNYVARAYYRDSLMAFSTLVSYYERQTQGKTIHSPKNCLPGAGWEIVSGGTAPVAARGQSYRVNRYVLKNGSAMALAYYWYQGRGRVAANEYVVKWNLLRDAALVGHSEEALVRVVVPVHGDATDADAPLLIARADSTAVTVTARLIPDVDAVLPRRSRS